MKINKRHICSGKCAVIEFKFGEHTDLLHDSDSNNARESKIQEAIILTVSHHSMLSNSALMENNPHK